jgi:hypothetical protein
MTPKDTKRVSTTGCFLVLQFNAVKKQFVATRNVPSGCSIWDKTDVRFLANLERADIGIRKQISLAM